MSESKPDMMHEALEWHALMNQDSVHTEEAAAFQSWLTSDVRHRRAFDEAERFWVELTALNEAPIDHLRDQEPAAVAVLPAHRSLLPRSIGWATAAGVVIMAYLLAWVVLPIENEFNPRTLTTATGEIGEFTLADGSTVALGARSSAQVVITQEARRVDLLEGTAYFDVVQADAPFEVRIDSVLIQVTGTQFSVEKGPGRTQIAVAEGAVTVINENAHSPTVRLRKMAGGQRLVAKPNRLENVLRIDPAKVGSWRAHRLVYEEAPLAHLISDLNRYRDHPLRLTEARLANEKITATFDATDSDQAVATLIELYDLELEAGIDAVTLRPLREKM